MSLLSGLGGWLRHSVDDIGSFITGQPAHGPQRPNQPAQPQQAQQTAPPPTQANTAPQLIIKQGGNFKPPTNPMTAPQNSAANSSAPPPVNLSKPNSLQAPNPLMAKQKLSLGSLKVNAQPSSQQINVPQAQPGGVHSWSTPQPIKQPVLGTPGHGINIGHFPGSGIVENAINAPEQIARAVQLSRSGEISHEQAIGQVGGALLNSAGNALPVGRGAELLGQSGKLAPRIIAGAKSGIKIGTGFGAAGGALGAMSQGGNTKQIIKSAAINAPISGAIGGVVGGGLPIAGASVKIAMHRGQPVAPQIAINQPVEGAQEIVKGLETQSKTRPLSADEQQLLQTARNSGKIKISQPTQGVKPNVPEVQPIKITPPPKIKISAPEQNAEIQPGITGKAPQKGQLPREQLSAPITKKLQYLGPGARQNREIRGITSDVSSDLSSRHPSANYTTNPTTVDISEVNPGDYEKARSNAQLASQPIEYSAGQVARIARSEKLTTSKLGRLVEGTDKPVNDAQIEAIKRYRQFADRVHATSQALGGNTPYRPNYFHHEWDLTDPNAAIKFEQFRQRKFGRELNPTQFEGLDRQPRVFDTVAQGEAAGFKLKNPEAAADILDYGKGAAYALKRQALAKGFSEADANELEKPRSFDLGGGDTIALSERGNHEIRAFEQPKAVNNPALKGYRIGNRKLKQTLLSASEFHPINITKKAAPALALKGHPVLAAKGAYGAFRGQIGRAYADKLQQAAFENGTVDAAARIGTPIKFGSDYESEGKLNLGKAGFGEKTIFEKSIPSLHIRMVQGVVKDLESKGIPLDSPEARAAGTRINEIMGFVNTEVRNLDKGHQKFLGDVALAPQFTRAKWATIKSALHEGGVGGSYARRAVIGDALATATVMLGLGYLAKQKSDNVKDMLIRALVHPSVPTPFKDSKGNTIELGMPSTYTSEALGLVANINRNPDGHIGISFKPSNIGGNLENYGRARLAILPGAGLKVATNTDFGNKPLYDPNAPLGTKAQQAGTILLTGAAPIGLQGIAETNAIKSHLPQGAQQVLTANTPGSSPIIKSIGSSFGLTPRTDKTVGKGLQTTQYFDALDQAKSGLNRQEKDAIDLYSGSKKNPVTGAYDIAPTVDDQRAKATTLLQNPKVIDHLIAMNQQLANEGQAVDPLWQQSKDKIVSYLQYQAMPPAGPDQANWRIQNPWYEGGANSLANQRSAFFNSLPPGDPNKPKAPIEYPTPDPQTASDMSAYFSMTDPTQKAAFLTAHPNVADQFDKQADYNNALRVSQGYGALRTYPKPNAHVQAILDAMPQGNDPASRRARAIAYQDPQVAAWSQEDAIYNLTKGAGLAQIQGNSLTSNDLKATQSLQYDIARNPDGTLSLMYSDAQGGTGASPLQAGAAPIGGGSSYKSSSYSKKPPFFIKKRVTKVRPHYAKKAHKVFLNKGKPIKIASGGAGKHSAVKIKSGGKSIKIAKAKAPTKTASKTGVTFV